MTGVWKRLFLPGVSSAVRVLGLACLICTLACGEDRVVPNPGGVAMNQLVLSGGNACGPAAMITAFRMGDRNWQRVSDGLAGATEKERLWSVIRERGMRPSQHLNGRMRWTRAGVNVADLTDMANEMSAGHSLPGIRNEVLFLKAREDHEELLRRALSRMATSMGKGLPAVISLRRFALRGKGEAADWQLMDAHFVTVISVPKKVERGARSFAVSYVDPWGGKRGQGVIAISDKAFLAGASRDPGASPCLEALFPDAAVGKKLVRAGEATVLTLAAVVGRW